MYLSKTLPIDNYFKEALFMGLFDKIKKAIDDSGVVDAAKSAVKNIKDNIDTSSIPSSKPSSESVKEVFDIPMEKREPELSEFYTLFIESKNCSDAHESEQKGVASIDAYIKVYQPNLAFLDYEIKKAIWTKTSKCGVDCNYEPKNKENKNRYLHFIYAMKNVDLVEDFEDKVMFVLDKAINNYRESVLENDSLYTNEFFSLVYKKFVLIYDFLPVSPKVCDDNSPAVLIKTFETLCEHGICVACKDNWRGEKLYCTCDASTNCSNKRKYDIGELTEPEFVPLIKLRNIYESNSDIFVRNRKLRELVEFILYKYTPVLNSNEFILYIENDIAIHGVNESKPIQYIYKLYNDNTNIKLERVNEYLKAIRNLYKLNIDVPSCDWLSNPDIYDCDNFDYVFSAFAMFSDRKWLSEHLLDDSVVDLKEFYNEDGTIKDAGGVGVEGDTIFNVIEKWSAGNENQEAFDNDNEMKRRMAVCKSCARYDNCNSWGKHEECAAYIPKKTY